MDVGVIGGQDGPTAILTGGDPIGFIVMLLLAAAAVGGAVRLLRRKRNK